MKLKDVEAGKVHTYVRGRVTEYSHGEHVLVLSTEPHRRDRATDDYVPEPGATVGQVDSRNRLVGVLILRAPDAVLSSACEMTVEQVRAMVRADNDSIEASLDVVRQHELHPAGFREELTLRRRQLHAEMNQAERARAEESRRRALAAERVLLAVGGKWEPEELRHLPLGLLEALAAELARRDPERVLARAAQRIRAQEERLREVYRSEGIVAHADPRYGRRLGGLSEAAGLVDPKYAGTDWIDGPVAP